MTQCLDKKLLLRNWIAEMQAAIDEEAEANARSPSLGEQKASGSGSDAVEDEAVENDDKYWEMYARDEEEPKEEDDPQHAPSPSSAVKDEDDEGSEARISEASAADITEEAETDRAPLEPGRPCLIVGAGPPPEEPAEESSDDADYWDDMAGTDYDG